MLARRARTPQLAVERAGGPLAQRREALTGALDAYGEGEAAPRIGDAQLRKQLLGRTGRLPWGRPWRRHALSYIRPSTIVTVPVAHCLLRGVLDYVLRLALTTPVQSITEAQRAVVFGSDARLHVSVRKLRESPSCCMRPAAACDRPPPCAGARDRHARSAAVRLRPQVPLRGGDAEAVDE